jgi:hypothetical protein
MVLRLLRIFRVLRVLRLLNTGIAAGLRDLLIKLLLSAPAITNVLSVLVLIMFIYAIFGINLFCFVKPGESLEFASACSCAWARCRGRCLRGSARCLARARP